MFFPANYPYIKSRKISAYSNFRSQTASGRSIGARLVSAIIAIKNNKETGKRGIMYQIACCDSIIKIKLKEPDKKMTIRISRPKNTSQVTIWAVDLKEPSKEYFEFAAHPENITPKTPNEDIANKNIIPKDKSEIKTPILNGITAQEIILNVKDKIGAKINNHLFEVVGYIVSLKINLTPSATTKLQM